MVYFFIGLAEALIYILLLIFTLFVRNSSSAARLAYTEAAVSAVGFCGIILTPVAFNIYMSHLQLDADKYSWASDAFYLYFWYSAAAALVLAIITTAAALLKNKMQPVREWCAAAAMIAFQIAAYAYAFTVKNTAVNINLFVNLVTYFEIAFLFACIASDSFYLRNDWREAEMMKAQRKAMKKKR